MVNRQYLADEGAYGVEKAVVDTAGRVVTHGKKTRLEFGGRVILKFKKDIFKNVNLDSYLDLFSNYGHNPGNIDVVFVEDIFKPALFSAALHVYVAPTSLVTLN